MAKPVLFRHLNPSVEHAMSFSFTELQLGLAILNGEPGTVAANRATLLLRYHPLDNLVVRCL